MPVKRSAGAVVFYRNPSGKIEYLLLKHSEHYWNFPKGGIEKGEGEIQAAKREIFEETALKDVKFLPGFRVVEKYFYHAPKDFPKKEYRDKPVFKIVSFYLAESKTKDVKISYEHKGFDWLSLKETLSLFRKRKSYHQSREIIKKANSYLFTKKKTHDIKKYQNSSLKT